MNSSLKDWRDRQFSGTGQALFFTLLGVLVLFGCDPRHVISMTEQSSPSDDGVGGGSDDEPSQQNTGGAASESMGGAASESMGGTASESMGGADAGGVAPDDDRCLGSSCDDGNDCTEDRCSAGACEKTILTGEPCDDALDCSTTDTCRADGTCQGDMSACGPVAIPSSPPADWTCAPGLYADGSCDCGCGASDADCSALGLEACNTCQCQVCQEAGGCPLESCPVDPANNAQCTWICPNFFYDDSECDCGCGATEPDCDSTDDADDCDAVWCNPFGEEDELVDGAIFSCADDPPLTPDGWLCSPYFYRDGFCDCGCGVIDADCDGNTNRDVCNFCVCVDSTVANCPLVANDDNSQCTL